VDQRTQSSSPGLGDEDDVVVPARSYVISRRTVRTRPAASGATIHTNTVTEICAQ